MNFDFRRLTLRAAAALAVALSVAPAAQAQAQAQPASAPSAQISEPEALGAEVAHLFLTTLDMRAQLLKEAGDFKDFTADIKSRPEWADMMRDAMVEELDHDTPAFERLVGRGLAEDFTAAEMRAVLAFMKGPGGAALLTVMKEEVEGRPHSTPSREATKALNRFMATPTGEKFARRLQEFERVMEPITEEMIAELIPGVFRRFADKAEAGEATRRAAAGR